MPGCPGIYHRRSKKTRTRKVHFSPFFARPDGLVGHRSCKKPRILRGFCVKFLPGGWPGATVFSVRFKHIRFANRVNENPERISDKRPQSESDTRFINFQGTGRVPRGGLRPLAAVHHIVHPLWSSHAVFPTIVAPFHTNVKNMTPNTQTQTSAADYDFQLPRELIAQQPTRNREDARLLVVDRQTGEINHSHFRDLAQVLNPGDCLVLNETRVIAAKLVGRRTNTGGRWQGLYLEHDPESGIVRLLCKTRGRIQPGEQVTLQDREGVDRHQLTLVAKLDGGQWAAQLEPGLTVEQMLDQLGRIPLPHYIRDGNMTDADVDDYQTVYATSPGSIAAPTAGLHFTDRLLNQLVGRGVRLCRVRLHVGTGTFRPIATEWIEQHSMHAEWGELAGSAADILAETRNTGGRIVAVGTTSVRLLETAGQAAAWSGSTDLYIQPGHRFRMVDALITNFHLPRTTLLVLVRSFGGDELIKRAYREAIDQEYRFFSYGDGMIVV